MKNLSENNMKNIIQIIKNADYEEIVPVSIAAIIWAFAIWFFFFTPIFVGI